MAVPNGAKRRHGVHDKQKHKRFKPNGKPQGGFGPGARFGPPAMLREAFGPGPFPAVRGPGPFPRFGPPPLFMRPGFRPPFPPFPRPPFLQHPPRALHPPRPPRAPLPPRAPFPQRAPFRPRLPPPEVPPEPPEEAEDMSKPWVSAEIRAENGRRLRLARAARLSRQESAWGAARAARSRLHALMKEAKEKYLSRHPEKVVSEAFQINPDSASKGVDFTEDLKF